MTLRRMAVLAVLCVAVLVGVSLATRAAAQGQKDAAEKIIAAAMGSGPLEENLRKLTDEVGGRVPGTPAMRKAVEWGVAAFKQAGVDDVRVEKFPMPASWTTEGVRLAVMEPPAAGGLARNVMLVSLGWSPATPPGGLTANIVDIGRGTEEDFAKAGARVKGSLLLVHNIVLRTWVDLFTEYQLAPGIVERAVKGGAAGILWMSTRERGLLYRHQSTFDGTIGPLPQAVVAREDAEWLARVAAAHRTVRVRLELMNKTGGPLEEENVVAEIRGSEKPDEIVLLGAHLDSWDLGTGALDNGCNSALVIDAARAIKAAGLRPKRTLRFVLFGGEEQGMHGSLGYVRAHRAELDKMVAAVIYDEGIGRVTGYSLGGRGDIEAAVREVLRPIESWGANTHTTDAFLGTDNFDFLIEGIPTLVATQMEANYIENYHAWSDTLDKVDIRELKLHVALAAITVYGISERPDRLGKRQTRAEIDALMKSTGLDAQVKANGLWGQWEKKERGRRE